MSWLLIKIKEYWKYILVLGIFVLAVLFYIFREMLFGKPEIKKDTDLQKKISEVAAELTEVSQVAAVQVAAARTEETGVKEELKTVMKIDDGEERRRKLLALYQRTGK